MIRGELWWADVPGPVGSAPGFRRPALVLQADLFSQTRLRTVIVVLLTSNLQRASMPGNVPISAKESGLPRDSVINVTQLVTVDKTALNQRIGRVSSRTLEAVADGVRLVLDL